MDIELTLKRVFSLLNMSPTLQSGIHHLGYRPGPRLSDDDPHGDPDGAGDAEDGEVGEEDEFPRSDLDHLHTDAEGDDELVTGDGWK